VDAVRAAALVGAAVPALAGATVVPLAEGWDNTVHVVAGTWAFRFPRRAVALPGFRRELAVLPALAPLLPAPVPVPEVVAEDDDPTDPWPFWGARLLPGGELADSALPDADRTALAAATGAFLRALHAPATRAAVAAALATAGAGDLPIDPMHRGWPAARVEEVRARLALLRSQGTWTPDAALAGAVEEVLARAAQLPGPPGEQVLVHGDLHVRHLLVDTAGDGPARLAGVIDWGDACWASPAVDLSVAYGAFEGAARAALLAAYGPVDEDTSLRARALSLRLSCLLAEHAASDDRPVLLAEALAGLRRAAG
jgi:aminoglycoside phosphotransferase (APT) family kinase protein